MKDTKKELQEYSVENGWRKLSWQERHDIYIKTLKPGHGVSGCSLDADGGDTALHKLYDSYNVPRWIHVNPNKQ